jgi:hypothetical protein
MLTKTLWEGKERNAAASTNLWVESEDGNELTRTSDFE